jgi:hypothetical protein
MTLVVHVSERTDDVVLETPSLRVEVTLRPFAFTVSRDGRSLLRGINRGHSSRVARRGRAR